MRKMTRTAATLFALAAATGAVGALAANAAKSGTTYGEVEAFDGVRFHSVGFDTSYNHDAARRQAWDKAYDECAERGGYIAEFQAGATRPIVTTLNGAAEAVYVTCRTDHDVRAPSYPFLGDIIPPGKHDNGVHPIVTAEGNERTAYIGAIQTVMGLCEKRGEHLQHMSLGFFEKQKHQYTVTAHVTCAR